MSLEITIGPMFSGKTSKLINIYNQYDREDTTQQIQVINYIGDVRYSNKTNELFSHDKKQIPCISVKRLSEWPLHNNLDILLINEAQFFEDLYEYVLEAVEKYNIKVHIFGLDGDYLRRPFGKILSLVPYCDKIEKLNALCSRCDNGTKSIFSNRFSKKMDIIVIGSKDKYESLCRKCYISPLL